MSLAIEKNKKTETEPDFTSSDHYKVLGALRNATSEEIKRNYKSLAKKYHSDINGGG